jgi:5'-nucleotidase
MREVWTRLRARGNREERAKSGCGATGTEVERRIVRILVSNDDGVEAPGLRALAEALLPLGEVTVCAPDREQSASSHSISLHRPLRIEQVAPWGPIRRYSVDGTPTDAVYVAVNEILRDRRPDVVASGINLGPNLAMDVLYSGTVAAAMEGTAMGLASFAISLVARERAEYGPASAFAHSLAAELGKRRLPPGTLLNVNVPPGVPRGTRITRLGKRTYSATVVRKVDPRGRAYYWIGGDEQAHENVPGSDCDAVFDDGLISVTPLHLDLTLHALIEELNGWDLPGVLRSP